MIRRIARPMLATVFVIDGVETLRNPQPRVASAEPLVEKATPLVEKGEQAVNEHVSPNVPPVTKDTETLVKVLAGVKIGAGVTFALGKAPRLSALALAASHLPTTAARNDFWAESDPVVKSRKTTGMATDVALLGALMLATVDTSGRPGLSWRARKATDTVRAKLPGAKAESVAAGAALAGVAHNVADHARDAADTVREKAPEVAEQVREKAPEVAEQVREEASDIAETVREKAPEVAEQVREQASDLADTVREKAPIVVARLRKRAEAARKQAEPWAAQAREQAGAAAHVAAEQAEQARSVARDRAEHAREAVAARAAELDTDDLRSAADSASATAKKKSDKARKKLAKAIRP